MTGREYLKAASRSEAGRSSRDAGEYFETWLAIFFSRLQSGGLAAIEKTPEPFRQIGGTDHGGHFRAIRTKKAQADFAGVLRGGRAIFIEAKATAGDSIDRSRLRPDQRVFLDQRAALGAVVLVALGFQTETGHIDAFAVPWALMRDGKARHTREGLDAYRLPTILTAMEAEAIVARWEAGA